MKIRFSYVSNSSSSSFIILYNDTKLEFVGPNGGVFKFSTWDFQSLIESTFGSWHSDSTEVEAIGKDGVIEKIKSSWYLPDGEDAQETIKTIVDSELEECIYFQVAYSDELTMNLLKTFIKEGVFEVVYSSEDREKDDEDD